MQFKLDETRCIRDRISSIVCTGFVGIGNDDST